MLYGCVSLEYLDISNFDFDNFDDSDKISYMLSNSINIKYINLYNVRDNNILNI